MDIDLYGLAVEMIGEVPIQFEFIYIIGTSFLFVCMLILIISPILITYMVCRK